MTAAATVRGVLTASNSGLIHAFWHVASLEERRLVFVRHNYDRLCQILFDMSSEVSGLPFRSIDVVAIAHEMSDCFEQGGYDMGDVFVLVVTAYQRGRGCCVSYRELSV